MKKRKKTNKKTEIPNRNLVAKHASNFNKTQVFTDKTKYNRKAKHKNREPFPISFFDNMGKGFWLFMNGNLMGQRRVQTNIFLQG